MALGTSRFLLPLTQSSEQLHATIFAFKKDCMVVSVVGSAHSDQHNFHRSWIREERWVGSVKQSGELIPSESWFP